LSVEPSEQVADALLRSRRYRSIARPVALRIAARELDAAGGGLSEAIKRSKRRLHQIYGAFAPRTPRYARWSAELQAAAGDAEAAERVARRLLLEHASTRERSRDLTGFYRELRARVPMPARVLDVACGLNPLALPWMGLEPGTQYFACEIDEALVALLQAALEAFGVRGRAFVCDLGAPSPLPEADLALLLKALPCLEAQLGPQACALVDALPAPRVAVSFPAHALGDQRRGLREHHAERFGLTIRERGWSAQRFEAAGELVYIVEKLAPSASPAQP